MTVVKQHGKEASCVRASGSGQGDSLSKAGSRSRNPHIATGDMLRASHRRRSPLGQRAAVYMNAGALVPDEVACAVLERAAGSAGHRPGLPAGRLSAHLAQARGAPAAPQLARRRTSPAAMRCWRWRRPRRCWSSGSTGRQTCAGLRRDVQSGHPAGPGRRQLRRLRRPAGHPTGRRARGDRSPAAAGLPGRDRAGARLLRPAQGWPVRAVTSVGERGRRSTARILTRADPAELRLMGIQLKTPAQIAKLREANLMVADVLDTLEAAAAPGVSTWELNEIAAQRLKQLKGESAFLGYRGYPAVLCTSVNERGGPRHPPQGRGAEGRRHPVHRLRRLQGRLVRRLGPDHPGRQDGRPEAPGPDGVDPRVPGAAIAQCVPGNRLGDIGWAVQSLRRGPGLLGGHASSSATASAGRCTRRPTSRTTGSRARGAA